MKQDIQSFFERRYLGNPDVQEWLQVTEKIKNSTVLIVPGFFVNSIKWSDKNMIGNFFEDQILLLEKIGCKVTWVNTQTEQSIIKNAEIIRRFSADIIGPIIFLSHSRGCNDVLQVLLESEQLRAKTLGWISLQGLFKGSPISNFLELSHLDKLYGKFLKKIGGNEVVIHEMTRKSRIDFLNKNDLAINILTQEVPTLSLGTYLSFKWRLRPESFLKWSRDLMSLSGYKNDGIVNFESSLLPHSKKIILKEVDHIETVVHNSFRNIDRQKLTQALFCTLFCNLV